MKKRVIVIGGGVIACHYAAGLKSSSVFDVVALCDPDENCVARGYYQEVPFYGDYQKAIADLAPSAAIISTPVALHMPIAKVCMQSGLDVYVEKPLCQDLADLKDGYETAKENGKALTGLLHWQYADEVLFLKEYLQGKKIEKIAVRIGDDYACFPLGNIRKDRIGLAGAWMDSGINALSYVHEILPLDKAIFITKEEKMDTACGLPYYAKHTFQVGETSLEIVVDWTDEGREKTSTIVAGDKEIFVQHSRQQVYLDGELIFEKKTDDRLASHYKNLFAGDAIKGATAAGSELLHKILLQG